MEWKKHQNGKNWFLGMDIGGTSVKLLSCDASLQIENQVQIPTGTRSFEDVLLDCMQNIETWSKELGALPTGLGIGFPGIVDQLGTVLGAPNLPQWTGIKLKEIFGKLLGCPVDVANDANCAALAEAEYLKKHQGYHKVIFLTLGTGVGSGIVLDGKIYQGAKGFAGEAGHITVEPHGVKCGCGRIGCLEQYFSAKGIARVAREEFHFSGEFSIKQLFKRAHLGHQPDLAILERCIDALAIGVSGLCAMFDPDCIVLGGGISRDGDLLLDMLEPKLRQRVQYPGYTLPDMRISHYHDKAGGTGCLILAMQVVNNSSK